MQENTKFRLIAAIIALVTGLGGFYMVWHYSNWQTAVGVFLCLFAENMNKRASNG